MGIEITGIPELNRRINPLISPSFFRSLLNEIGLLILTRIKARTIQGKDVDGQAFEPYSKGYKLFRQKAGHPTRKVNLFFTGSMLASMNFSTDDDSVRVFFMNTTGKDGVSNPKKAFWNNERRNFFALSESDTRLIRKTIESYYRRFL